jgi:hypothetical protein
VVAVDYREAPLWNRIRRSVLGKEHPNTVNSMDNLAELYRLQNRRAEAGALYETTIELRRRVLGPAHASTTNVLSALGAVRLDEERYGETEALLRQAVAGYRKNNPDGWRRFYSEGLLGAALAGWTSCGRPSHLF